MMMRKQLTFVMEISHKLVAKVECGKFCSMSLRIPSENTRQIELQNLLRLWLRIPTRQANPGPARAGHRQA